MKRNILRVLLAVILLALIYGIHYAWISFPIISGYNAKQMCTCVFVSERDPKDIDTSDLGEFPLSIANNKVGFHDSSVTTTIWGMATKKAIYRKGIGCTLINDITEEQLRSQAFEMPSAPLQNADAIAWPNGDKIVDTLPLVINKPKLNAAVDNAFIELYPGKKQRTRAVVILYDGQLVAEKYASGFYKDTKMYGWSMAKSVTAALIGTLVQQKKLDIMQPAPVPEWRDERDPRHAITIENLLQQMSGLDFLEDYTKASDVTNMLYKEDSMAAFTARHKLAYKPGTVFSYSSGNSNILARIIRQTVGEQEYTGYPFNALFFKIGMHSSSFEPDASGTYVGSSYINATARDYARFGLLYYNDGVWNGERILPEGWVGRTRKSPKANKLKNYGYQFWLNGSEEKNPARRKYPDAPADMFYCDGFGYQFIYIIPSKKLVIVRLGLTLDRSFDENKFLKDVIGSINNK